MELRNPQTNYNKLTLAAAQKRYPALDPKSLLASRRLGKAQDLIIGQPAFFDELNAMLKTEPLADLKTYLRWHLVRSVAPALPTAYGLRRSGLPLQPSPDRGQAASQPPSSAGPSTATSGA
ncbi:hypothetical protein GCM10011495_38750 [Hymenobacter frigidus]|uniref:Peptidase M13 N-terminal domain-containing protein n=1 Tax=Hymenobacter frigidus TaxID=1524095 RepID=A0ABQ2AIX3_9BACT|nr:hypothetical protein GCM10011495_38750 [Hymenobacter frigidus]